MGSVPAFAQISRTEVPRMVTLDVTAMNERGEFVGDLRGDELQVYDNGRRQKIALYLPGEKKVERQSELMPREYSNRTFATFPHAVVIVLDQLQSKTELKSDEWNRILGAVSQEQAPNRLYFYALTKTGLLYPLHGLPDSWVDEAPREEPWAKDLPALFEDMRDLYRAEPSKADPDYLQKRKNDMGRKAAPGWALDELATRLAAVPGGRSIVWVGPPAAGKPKFEGPTPLNLIPVYRVGQPHDAALASATHLWVTGEIPPSGNIEKTIARALVDVDRRYRIGYFPADNNWDGKYHQLRVTSSRSNLAIQAKPGYDAVKPVDVADDRRQTIPDLVPFSAFDSSAIGLRASIGARGSGVSLDIRIDAPEPIGQLAIQPLIYTSDDQVEVLQEPSLIGRKNAVTLAVKLSASASRIRLVVLDLSSDTFGTVTVPIQNP